MIFLYLAICTFRILNALLIQTQFDPDEYWQTLEPAYCEAFGEPCAYTWEWRRGALDDEGWIRPYLLGPVRSYVSVLPTYFFYRLVKLFQWDILLGSRIVSKGPMLLHAVFVAAPTDICIVRIARIGTPPKKVASISVAKWALFCTLTSWFQGYAMIRTYSNSIEAMLLANGMALLAPELFGGREAPRYRLRTRAAFWFGGLSASVRFTALAAWIPLGVLLSLQRKKPFQFLLNTCACWGLLGIGAALVLDRLFYGFWTIPFLGSFHFNVLLGNGSLYGTHPWYWYFVSGLPAITGILLPFILLDALRCIHSAFPGQRNAWILILIYTLLHSFSEHKEFRFLLPILPLLCVRAAHVLSSWNLQETMPSRSNTRIRWSLVLFLVLPNVVAVLYLGVFHQRAPLDVNKHILQIATREQEFQTSKVPATYTVHYLMGCHSTPLYSHLHLPFVQFNAWTLDCSPDCRSHGTCESEQFLEDPVLFVEKHYQVFQGEREGASGDGAEECLATSVEARGCPAAFKLVPDFLVIEARDAARLKLHLTSMGLEETNRFIHGINGARLGSLQLGDDFSKAAYRHVSMFDSNIEVSLDEILLFAPIAREKH